MPSIERTYSVPDISCGHCTAAIEQSVGAVPGVTTVVANSDTKTVTVSGGDDAAVIAAIDDAGYDVVDH